MAASADCDFSTSPTDKRSRRFPAQLYHTPLAKILPPKPPLVRKNSGELVRPVLRPPTLRRPASAPATPSAKAVHFDDSRMEEVRHFCITDKPDTLSPNHSDCGDDCEDGSSACYELEPALSDLPRSSPERLRQMVRLDAVFLSDDGMSLAGLVEVANVAYEKVVVCRFTFDEWNTVSEMAAEYSAPMYSAPGRPGSYDGFVFSIDLGGLINVNSRTLRLCVRYIVDGKEFWDNNDDANFRIWLRRKDAESPSWDIPDIPFERCGGNNGYWMSPWSSLGLEPIERSEPTHVDTSSAILNGTCRHV